MHNAVLLIYVLSALVLIAYALFYFRTISNHNISPKRSNTPISVVICAKNEAQNLEKNLPLILSQNYPSFEILIIDDHSTDDTLSVLRRFAAKNEQLKFTSFTENKRNQGKKEALAFGILNAKHEIVLLTDADCAPLSENWIAEMTAGIDEDHQLNIGVSLLHSEKSSFFSWFAKLDAIWVACNYLGWALRKNPYMTVGRNVCYTKSLFIRTGKFDQHLHLSSGDDDLFAQAATSSTSFNCIIKPESQTQSKAPKTWRQWLKQKSRHQSTGIIYPKSTLILLGLHQLSIISFYFSAIYLFAVQKEMAVILSIFFLKNIIYWHVFKRIFSKIEVSERLLPFLFFELIWTVAVTVVNFYNLFRSSKDGGTWS